MSPASAQETNSQTTTATVQINPSTNLPPARAVSPAVKEILTMADAGVSMEVIKAYVQYSPSACQPTDTDVIALKKHNVTDEIVTLLLKRSSQARTAMLQAGNDALARALSARRMAAGGLDPDSYDYFQHYYLQPRALASAYERLAPYYYPSPYGYGPPFGPASGFPQARFGP